jgi:Protein of unknown function (DUF3048) N-terminal domain/Protein of unknown function (DUF3048) C-terminal domain
LALTACSHNEPKAVPSGASSSSPTPTTSSATPTPTPPPVSLLSGRAGKVNGPVYAVKVDNTTRAHPQQGLTKADVVYIEQVEGGVTRLAAIFSSAYPKSVGPVRSARISDIDLLRQYGTVGLIYSGSQTPLLPKLLAAKLKLVSFDASRLGYIRQSTRPMPYDVIGDFATLRKRAGKVSIPKAVGYTFGAAPTVGGTPATNVTIRYQSAVVGARWSASDKRYLLSMDGAKDMAVEGGQLGPTTLVVQYSKVVASPYHDVNGANTPLTETVGHGKALFFRDGQEFKGKWSRTSATQPTQYTFADGTEAVFAPGQIWIALLPKGRPVSAN